MSDQDPRKKQESWLDWLECQARKDDDLLIDNGETIEGIKQTRKLIDALTKVTKLGPSGCICHVRQADGYHGTNHSEACINFTNAWDELKKELE